MEGSGQSMEKQWMQEHWETAGQLLRKNFVTLCHGDSIKIYIYI